MSHSRGSLEVAKGTASTTSGELEKIARRYIYELSCLPRKMVVGMGVQCKCKGFMIGEDVEWSSLKIVSEMMNSKINC